MTAHGWWSPRSAARRGTRAGTTTSPRIPDQVWIEVGGRRHRVRAEQLDGPRRADAWARITASRPSMAGYQEKTDRILPVLRLTPAE